VSKVINKPTIIHQRVALCQEENYAQLIARVSSGWVVAGDSQFLSGYCLIYPDPVVAHLNELTDDARKNLLYEASVVGDALLEIKGAVRINYEILGNLAPALHVHIFPRFNNEAEALKTKPVWFYDWEAAPQFDMNRDRSWMLAVAEYLDNKQLILK